MNATTAIKQIDAIFRKPGGAWRELRSCVDAVQEVCIVLDATTARQKPTIRRVTPAITPDDLRQRTIAIARCIAHLRAALTYATHAPNTAPRIRRALTSAQGAQRHAEGRRFRQDARGGA